MLINTSVNIPGKKNQFKYVYFPGGSCDFSFIPFASVTRVYVPWFFVSSQQRFGTTDIKALGASQLSGLGQTVLQLLGKSVLQLYFI